MRSRLTYLRAWRKHRGLTQEQLEEKLVQVGMARDISERPRKTINRTQIARIESDASGYTGETAELLAEALDSSVWDLMFIDPENPKESARRLVEASPSFREGLSQVLSESFTPFLGKSSKPDA